MERKLISNSVILSTVFSIRRHKTDLSLQHATFLRYRCWPSKDWFLEGELPFKEGRENAGIQRSSLSTS